MIRLTSREMRQKFLDFFQARGHTIVPSSSLVPAGDPTLLFTNAGMVQFKDTFLGHEKRPYARATTAQKVLRVSGKHNDLENVGPSTRHHTFFEMLGNFSFGDYFKRDAIRFAWALLVEELQLDVDRLWFTVYRTDDEAAQLWVETGASPERVLRFGEKDNFWSMGDTGPCGPCSEIHYYLGDLAEQTAAGVNVDDHYVEIWNLVFMQFDRDAAGVLTPLPKPSVDTGMGFERTCMVLQGASNTYDTDLFQPIFDHVQQALGHSRAQRLEQVVSYRVIADHSRAAAFLIGDGVLPGNAGRNYVLRMLLRRAVRFGVKLGFDQPFLAGTVGVVIDTMGDHYRELRDRRDFILRAVNMEETRFRQTLATGESLLQEIMQRPDVQTSGVVPGIDAFRLYDTYGFPIDLTRDAAREQGLAVDEVGYQAAMAAQKERARSTARFAATDNQALQPYVEMLQSLRDQDVLGPEGVVHLFYETTRVPTNVAALLIDGQPVQSASAGSTVEVVIPETPFYVEAGGQVSDTGRMVAESEGDATWEIVVDDVRRPIPGLTVHRGRVLHGDVQVDDPALVTIDEERRLDIMRNHTATHLLHAALRHVLGPHVHQAGSLVAPDRLRFDFSHTASLSDVERAQIEDEVNQAILANHPVHVAWKPYQQAVAEGAMALFGEKYGDEVRVITVGGDGEPAVSRELCGGTHLEETGTIGLFVLTSEGSIGSGVRRVEAVTGRGAQQLARQRLGIVRQTATLLGAPEDELATRAADVVQTNQGLQKEVARLRQVLARREIDVIASQAAPVDGTQVVAAQVDAADVDTMRQMSDWLRDRLGSSVVVLGAAIDGRPNLIAAVTPDLVARGVDAGQLIRVIAPVVGGGGGGRPTLAQAGGKDPSRLPEALAQVVPWVAGRLHA
jgi:alanyl-tRNA synthetase